jgi:hypothetical protein
MGELGWAHCTTRKLITALCNPAVHLAPCALRIRQATSSTVFEAQFNIMLASKRSLFPSPCLLPAVSYHNVGEQPKIAVSSSSCSSSHPQFPILCPNIDDQFARNGLRALLQTVVPQHIICSWSGLGNLMVCLWPRRCRLYWNSYIH